MNDHRVIILRTGDRMFPWEVRIDNSWTDWAFTRKGAIRMAKRKLRAMGTEAEVYLVKDTDHD